ncbi:MAG: SRPBCC family protein [Actinomycetota bacterium]
MITVVDAGPRKVSRAADVQAPAAALFELVADPHRHAELDGSGTVLGTAEGPHQLTKDAKFSVRMKQYGVPYRITSHVTDLQDGRVVEWQHPLGHRWRWEFIPLAEGSTRVTETFDYSHISSASAKGLEVFGFPAKNAKGIESTLRQLQERHSGGAGS